MGIAAAGELEDLPLEDPFSVKRLQWPIVGRPSVIRPGLDGVEPEVPVEVRAVLGLVPQCLKKWWFSKRMIILPSAAKPFPPDSVQNTAVAAPEWKPSFWESAFRTPPARFHVADTTFSVGVLPALSGVSGAIATPGERIVRGRSDQSGDRSSRSPGG